MQGALVTVEPPSPAAMRRDYTERGELLEADLATSWTRQFEAWFADAAVNPVILLAERADPAPGATVRLASLPMPPDANQFVWDKSFKSALTHEDNGRQALDLWLDIKPFVAPGANEMGYAESTNAFMQGNGAMFINWYMTFSDVENPETSKVVGKVKYALPPRNTLEGDRHDYLGDGELGDAGCAVFLSEPRFEGLPCLLETPRPDGLAADLERCRKLRKRGLANRRRSAI